MKKNDIFEIEITGMTDDGRGVSRINGMAVFVPYVIVGETARVVIIKMLKSYAVGKLIEVVKPSPERRKAECSMFYKCGGCALMHMSYERELEFKRGVVKDCVERIGGFSGIGIDEIVPSPETARYRNKSQFPVTPDGIGMFAPHSHRLIEIDDCVIASGECKKIISAVKFWMKSEGIPAYDEDARSGLVRHLCVRTACGGTAVTIVTAKPELPRAEKLIDELKAACPGLTGVIQNVNPKNTNVILGKENRTLYGEPRLMDKIGGVSFMISPQSFYQVNPKQTERLYSIARDFADLKGGETLLDLYCGIGTIGQFMAERAGRIIGVEYVERAVADARENAKLNGIKNAEYYAGKAEEVIETIVKRGCRPDVAVLDPPRKGCDPKLLKTLAEIPTLKKIVYISCKPSTLARDMKILNSLSFNPKKITPVDMFPRTPHVETVCLMSRGEGK